MHEAVQKVVDHWVKEFPNVSWNHGQSTETKEHVVVCGVGFQDFTITHRNKMESYLKRHTTLTIDSIGMGPHLEEKSRLYIYLKSTKHYKQVYLLFIYGIILGCLYFGYSKLK